MSVQDLFFVVYRPILTKFGIVVGLWTLTTGKIFPTGYPLDNCFHGKQKTFLKLKFPIYCYGFVERRSRAGPEWPCDSIATLLTGPLLGMSANLV